MHEKPQHFATLHYASNHLQRKQCTLSLSLALNFFLFSLSNSLGKFVILKLAVRVILFCLFIFHAICRSSTAFFLFLFSTSFAFSVKCFSFYSRFQVCWYIFFSVSSFSFIWKLITLLMLSSSTKCDSLFRRELQLPWQ